MLLLAGLPGSKHGSSSGISVFKIAMKMMGALDAPARQQPKKTSNENNYGRSPH